MGPGFALRHDAGLSKRLIQHRIHRGIATMFSARLMTTSTELAALETPWNILAAGAPMRSWHWLATWWMHYGTPGERELYLIGVYDESESDAGTLVGLAPWYIEHSRLNGSVIRPLGDGEVCTDHQSILCRPDHIASVVTTLADFLTTANDDWDRLELTSVDEGDELIELLNGELEARDAMVTGARGGNCWIASFPETWDAFVANQSQSHRRQLRRCREKLIDTGRVAWHHITTEAELAGAWPILVDLHQRRRRSLGEPGCFASSQFAHFHREVATRLLAMKQLRLSWSELDGKPFTAEYHFSSPDTVYTYQSGMDVDRLEESPGRLAYLLTFQRAIEEGFLYLDFMRGDEPYKAHWRADARPMYDYHVFPNRTLAMVRGHVSLAARAMKDWVKQGLATVKG
jgi:CelD/BcsL family acetyltransferase involved in cellulose biosynthesis